MASGFVTSPRPGNVVDWRGPRGYTCERRVTQQLAAIENLAHAASIATVIGTAYKITGDIARLQVSIVKQTSALREDIASLQVSSERQASELEQLKEGQTPSALSRGKEASELEQWKEGQASFLSSSVKQASELEQLKEDQASLLRTFKRMDSAVRRLEK